MKKIIALMLLIVSVSQSAYAYYETSDLGNVIETDGEVFLKDTSKEYVEKGSFSVADFVGFDNKEVRVSNGVKDDSVFFSNRVTADYYEIFYWKSIFEEGDPNAKVDFIASGSQLGTDKMDFSEGVAGWESLGIFFCHDGYGNVTITSSGEGKIPATMVRFVKRTKEEYNAYRIFAESKNVILLKANNRNSIVKKQKVKIPDVAPEIINGTTFVPIRFVTENFDADVLWDANEKKVTVLLAEHKMEFYVGKEGYFVDGKEFTLLASPYIKNGRTMVPIRAISEGVGKTVKWEENGLIIICDELKLTGSEYNDFVQCAGGLIDKL